MAQDDLLLQRSWGRWPKAGWGMGRRRRVVAGLHRLRLEPGAVSRPLSVPHPAFGHLPRCAEKERTTASGTVARERGFDYASPQTSCAISTQRASFFHWSASVRSLPCEVEEKPHWWLSAHCSSGT